MEKLAKFVVGGLAAAGAFAQTAFAGAMGYSPDPIVEDGGGDAAIFLVLAVAALLVINSIAAPKAGKSGKDKSE